jgi:ribosome recycling factor
MIEDIKKDAEKRMQSSIERLKDALAKLRTGRANPGLLEHVTVSYYGSDVPLNQVAKIGTSDARTLTVEPFEANMVAAVEKAIMTSDLGLNPATSGKLIRVPLPALTEERRKEFVKVVREEVEQGRVAIRNIRRDANSDLKDLLKEKEITEDEQRKSEEFIQKLTDKYIANADELLEAKEQDLMQV